MWVESSQEISRIFIEARLLSYPSWADMTESSVYNRSNPVSRHSGPAPLLSRERTNRTFRETLIAPLKWNSVLNPVELRIPRVSLFCPHKKGNLNKSNRNALRLLRYCQIRRWTSHVVSLIGTLCLCILSFMWTTWAILLLWCFYFLTDRQPCPFVFQHTEIFRPLKKLRN